MPDIFMLHWCIETWVDEPALLDPVKGYWAQIDEAWYIPEETACKAAREREARGERVRVVKVTREVVPHTLTIQET